MHINPFAMGFSTMAASAQRGVTEHPSPDGGIESTAQDVHRFYHQLFYGNTLLSPEKSAIAAVFNLNGEHWSAFGGGMGVSAAVELDLVNDIEIVVLANTDKLVAERISGRILSALRTSDYPEIKLPETNFAYSLYRDIGKQAFIKTFKDAYQAAGYTQFIGRALNELGMEMLDNQAWQSAFDVFDTLVALFPEAPQAYDSLAYAHFRKGQPQQAKKTFAKATALQPDFTSEYQPDNYQQ